MLRYTVRFVSIYRNKRALWSKSKILVFCQLYIYIYIYIYIYNPPIYIYTVYISMHHIYIYIYRYQRQIWGKVSFTWEHLWYTPPAHCHDNNSYNFSDFQLYQVTLPIDPPISTLKQKLEMVYSFTFYTALYIYISIVPLWIVSFGVEQVNRSVMHLFLCQIFMILSCCCCCCCVFHHNIYMLLLFVVVVVLHISNKNNYICEIDIK